MELAQIRESLDSVQNIEEQAQVLEDTVNALEELHDPSLVPPVLGVFERCGSQDDFGLFGSLLSFVERFSSDPASRLAVQASVRLAPSWPSLQLLPAFSTTEEARAILQHVLKDGSFRDPRYSKDWLEKKLAELP